jgi:hypothetical protein
MTVYMQFPQVLTHINDKKKESMECFTQSLSEHPQQTQKVRKCMEKLMRILQKDRHHTLSHYKHLIKSSPKQSELEEGYTLQRLSQISQTARQALKMLGRYPEVEAKIKDNIEDYVLGLQGRDDQGQLLTATNDSDEILLRKLRGMTEHGVEDEQQEFFGKQDQVAMVTSQAPTTTTTTSSSSSVAPIVSTENSVASSTNTPSTPSSTVTMETASSTTNNDNRFIDDTQEFTHEQVRSWEFL